MNALPERELVIESLAHDGRGVARADGKAVFVAGALPGERVRARALKRHRRFDEAVAIEVLEPAPGRVAPRCPHFGVCGGCAMQHLDEARQLEIKRLHVEEQFTRIGRVTPAEWLPPLGDAAWAYRRRARLGVKWVPRKGRVLVGFRERATPYIAEIDSCAVLAAPVGGLIGALAALVGRLSIRERLPQIEVAVGERATALVLRVLDPPSAADLAELRAFAAAEGVEFYLQPRGYDTVAPLDPPATPLGYTLPDFDVEVLFEPTDFIQVNADLNRRAVALAVRLLDPRPDETVLDLFCGLGNFTLPLARRAARVVGVEGEAGLVARARANAARNGIANAGFHVADLAQDLGGAPWANETFHRVLLDPPRAGAAAALPLVARLRPARIVYVSCHPASLARDAGELVHVHGFRLAAAGVMDMFPQTAHVESIAVFEPG
ncbi:MAG: 23S rRNA (uracil(1939)-C(5))-methyltransferase RlmD [Steroidobacteraceae bacterium]|nr:23S rRNA (uracil(1939)-C(5))-methyltransferase RlmD [Steroidobacteraceae bacterium]